MVRISFSNEGDDVPQDEKAWLKAILDRVVPLTPEEVEELLTTWKKWAWMQAHDPDCADDFQEAADMQLRLIVTLRKVWAAEKQKEETTK